MKFAAPSAARQMEIITALPIPIVFTVMIHLKLVVMMDNQYQQD